MEKRTALAARAVACALCLMALTAVFGWFVGRYIPGDPSVEQPQAGPESPPVERMGGDAGAFSIADAAAGEARTLDSLTLSSAYLGDTDVAAHLAKYLGDDAWAVLKSGDAWEAEIPAFSMRVESARVVTGEAFAQWYPNYAALPEGLSAYGDYETKFVIVEASVENKSDERMRAFAPWLWGEKMAGASDASILGVRMGSQLAAEMYGEPTESPDTRQNDLDENWDSIEPGQTRTFTFAYPVYRSLFESPSDFDDIDLSRLYVEMVDCGAQVRYRFYLA